MCFSLLLLVMGGFGVPSVKGEVIGRKRVKNQVYKEKKGRELGKIEKREIRRKLG